MIHGGLVNGGFFHSVLGRTMATTPHRKEIKHYNVPGDAHFLTFSCYRQLPLLSKDRTRLWFVEAVEKARAKHQFDLWAWVIMPEHVHLLLYPRPADYAMDKILASIKKPVGAKAIRFLREQASGYLERLTVKNRNRTYHRFWQAGPGYDRNLRDPQAIHRVITYIHRNPVKRGLVEQPEDWPWSSAADWAGAKVPFLKIDGTVPSLHVHPRSP